MQGLKSKLYLYAKPALRVDLYFHILALVQAKLNFKL
jgi:hypothetical protein